MPVIEIETNVKAEDSKALVVKVSKFTSQIFGKPENLVLVKYTHNEALCWGGTFDPAFVLTIVSAYNHLQISPWGIMTGTLEQNEIGAFSPEKNPSIVKEFTKFLKENLGIDDKRGYIVLKDPGKDTTGYSGTTVTKLFSK